VKTGDTIRVNIWRITTTSPKDVVTVINNNINDKTFRVMNIFNGGLVVAATKMPTTGGGNTSAGVSGYIYVPAG